MAEYNPSKIIKDGNTYNFRDTTKIPLAGSNEISGSLIPSTDGTVNLGSSSYQWNNVYIKSLTINGVACGDILTHNASEFANDSDVVHKSGDETINGTKTFTSETVNTSVHASRHIFGEYGTFWRQDGSNLYLMLTNSGDQYGGWNDFRPLTVNLATGICSISGTAGGVAWANVSGRPTKVSQFTNDSGYITSADLFPIGSYIQFAGSQAPSGFLVCNGGAISRTTYSKLFAVIGTTYGSGNGSTTFNLPNLTDRFLQGSTTSGTVKNAGLPNITGSINNIVQYGPVTATNGSISSTNLGVKLPSGANENCGNVRIDFNAFRSSSIYGNSSTVQPPALTCLICIKY